MKVRIVYSHNHETDRRPASNLVKWDVFYRILSAGLLSSSSPNNKFWDAPSSDPNFNHEKEWRNYVKKLQKDTHFKGARVWFDEASKAKGVKVFIEGIKVEKKLDKLLL